MDNPILVYTQTELNTEKENISGLTEQHIKVNFLRERRKVKEHTHGQVENGTKEIGKKELKMEWV